MGALNASTPNHSAKYGPVVTIAKGAGRGLQKPFALQTGRTRLFEYEIRTASAEVAQEEFLEKKKQREERVEEVRTRGQEAASSSGERRELGGSHEGAR